MTVAAKREDLPASFWLLPAAIRPKVHAFQRFARAADDIASDPVMSPEVKLSRLVALDPRLLGPGSAEARQILAAYKCDAVRNRTPNWQDLLDYCTLAAVPIGRLLLSLHGAGVMAQAPCDRLCVALQVMSLIVDLRFHRRRFNRVYLPLDWLSEAGIGVGALDAEEAGPELRQVIDRLLDKVDEMLIEATPLPWVVHGLRLKLETWAMILLAKRLARRLRQLDPLRVAPASRRTQMAGTFRGLLREVVGA
jgi:phytoene/squalene synthetase